ncbi:MAG: O-methyltransferase [Sphingobacteriia bacterium]|nr:MAG: O-methyltransferase [Sphingobacteriia bacterium]
MEWLLPLAEAYTKEMSSPGPAYLAAIEAETLSLHPKAHMLCGPVVGRFLALLSSLKQPRYILEIGSFTGYSGLCLAEGLAPGGELHSIEARPAEAAIARRNFNQFMPQVSLHLHEGDAHEILKTLHHPWDLVFMDADKTGYAQYLEQLLPVLAKGALVIVDNTLFHGQVLQTPVSGKNAKAVQDFNQAIKTDPRWEVLLLSVRDGISLIRKKNNHGV